MMRNITFLSLCIFLLAVSSGSIYAQDSIDIVRIDQRWAQPQILYNSTDSIDFTYSVRYYGNTFTGSISTFVKINEDTTFEAARETRTFNDGDTIEFEIILRPFNGINLFKQKDNIVVVWPTGTGIKSDTITRTVTITDFVSIATENLLTRVRIHPNPASDFISLESDGGLNVQLYSADGRLLHQWQNLPAQAQLPVGDLPKGAYLLHLRDNSGHQRVVKIMIE